MAYCSIPDTNFNPRGNLRACYRCNNKDGEDKMNKVKEFFVANIVSWLIELAILSTVAFITLGYVKETNEKTQLALQQATTIMANYDAAVTQFFAGQSRAINGAASSILSEVKDVDIEGVVDVSTEVDTGGILNSLIDKIGNDK